MRSPLTRRGSVVTRRRKYTLQEHIVVALVAHLLLLLVLAINIYKLRREHHLRSRGIRITRHRRIHVLLGVTIEHRR